MKNITFYIILSIAGLFSAQAQTKFSRLFWNAPEIITTNSVAQTPGGEYVVAGAVKDTAAGSLNDLFLAKFSSIGDTLWTRRIAASGADVANAVQQTYDGGYIIAGQTDSYGQGNYDMLLLKTDASGNVSWAKTFGDTWINNVYSVKQNTDSGFIIAGQLYPSTVECFVMRTNAIGDTLWTRTFKLNASANASIGGWAEQTADGGFIVAARADSSSNGYIMVLKLTASGNITWGKKIGVSTSAYGYSIKQTMDGGYLLAGQDYFGFSDPIIVKLDINGNAVFKKSLHLIGGNYLQSIRANQLPDSTYLVFTSLYYPPLQNYNTYLIKLNQTGDTLWSKKFPASYTFSDAVFTNDGGIATVGYPGGIHKLDSAFDMECASPVLNSGYTIYNMFVGNANPIIGGGTTVASASFTNMGYTSRHLYTPCTPNVPTCVVTVDSASQQNLVVWEENFDTTFIDSYNIYKETAAAGQYALIGTVPHNQLSAFLDIASNPAVQSNRYRVSALWNTFYEPRNIVAGHKTIHLTVSPGIPSGVNLIWSSYEGFSYSTYNIWRGNSSAVGIIASVPYGTNSYTDLSPPAGDSLYFIEVIHSPCTPTFIQPPFGEGNDVSRSATSYSGTRSNIANGSTITLIDDIDPSNFIVSVFPSPASNEITILNAGLKIKEIEIYNVLGEKRLALDPSPQKEELRIDVSSLVGGIYFVKVKTESGTAVARFVKQ